MQLTSEMRKEFEERFSRATIRPDKADAVKRAARSVASGRERYELVAKAIGCPWFVVGILHGMECGFSFSGWLANGDPLTGPTIHVPAGLRCNGTWEDGAIVSLKHDGADAWKDWTLAGMLFFLERFNGFGYRSKGKPSQYLWSFTSIEEAGRYIRDGVWDPNAWSGQAGCVSMMKQLLADGFLKLESPSEETPRGDVNQEVTWFDLFRLDQNGRVTPGIVGMDAQNRARATLETNDIDSLIAFRKQFPNAKTFGIAPASKPWPNVEAVTPPPAPTPEPAPKGPAFLRITRTGRSNSKGLEVLKLEMMNGGGEVWLCHSGAPGRQVFQRGGADNVPGSLYPCPQGEYSVEDISWAGGKDNYQASHGPGLGPVFVPFNPRFSTRRGAFGFHLDENAATSPGSAGCVVLDNLEELKRFVAALRKWDPQKFIVQWDV